MVAIEVFFMIRFVPSPPNSGEKVADRPDEGDVSEGRVQKGPAPSALHHLQDARTGSWNGDNVALSNQRALGFRR